MRIDRNKLDLARAKKMMMLKDLPVSVVTIQRINDGKELRPITVGRIAEVLECEVEDIIVDERSEDGQ